ncbi:hypothetical protein KRR40_18440 [Niabella defluvii]|nr:hypothetical protein KRR40_18440 [Niabella sp. I65]
MKKFTTIFIPCLLLLSVYATTNAQEWQKLAPPKTGKIWVQPTQNEPAQPVWGHAKGLQVGLSPCPAPGDYYASIPLTWVTKMLR